MSNNSRCLYDSEISVFLSEDANAIFGKLNKDAHGDILTTQREAWEGEISILQDALIPWKDVDGKIIFEYIIPRLGGKIDVVVLLKGIIFCIEFKVGQSKILLGDIDQVLDYALDLKNFHKFSETPIIVPILVATQYDSASSVIQASIYDDRVVNPLVTGTEGLTKLITDVISRFPNENPIDKEWINSPYVPTPTIIEAARTLYESHSVEDITRHEADKVSTDATIAYILDVIHRSKQNGEKSICFVTGVPGAGKTLVGLDVAVKQTYQGSDKPVEDEGAVYLSGNGPLVAVLNEALAKDNYEKCREKGESKKLSDSRREVGKFIQIIHRYRDNMLAKIKNPVENGVLEIDPEKAVRMNGSGYGEVEHVAIFDEAQRSWTHKRLADYLKRGGTYGNKLKVANFPMSEASFLIWSLDQREDWATIVCLVGGGQEINTGEEKDKKLAEAAKLKEIYDKLGDLIGVKGGSDFEVFVQGIAMRSLLVEANNIMHDIIPDYDLKQKGENSIEFHVIERMPDNTEIKRELLNFSGGEKFVISLSLALAMSEFAGQNGDVECIFLDEGFGTLSGKPLDDAIDALKKLSNTGKMLGIITHIDPVIQAFNKIEAVKSGERSVLKGPGVICTK